MRDPARIAKVIGLLHKYWGQNPDLRLGQIISNLTPDRHRLKVVVDHYDPNDPDAEVDLARLDERNLPDPYHVEDTEWEEILRAALKEPA